MSVTNTMRVTNIMNVINTMNVTNIMCVPTVVEVLRHSTAAETHVSFSKGAACVFWSVLQLQKTRHLYVRYCNSLAPHTSPFS
jgi:hypothetical protein